MSNITPCLWFDDQAEDAMNFYLSIFKDGKELAGKALTVTFSINGQTVTGMNGGPHFKFTESFSFIVSCEDQAEVDYYWDKLLEGGEPSQCGWLKDKYGLSWQIVPVRLIELMQDEDTEKASRVMNAMMQMVKIDVPSLEEAAASG
jgi:predicted 3-demethylubiquinone-9 3-methyltransferase (glyoxalase superfamily)